MKYCAFLRGVNVNGTSMKMAEVCKVFSNAGTSEVSSVLATGNLIFSSDKSAADLKIILEKAMSDYFNYEAFLFIKSEKEVVAIFENSPFTKADDLHIYAFVGTEDIESVLLEEFDHSQKTENENAQIIEHIFYWQVPKGNTLDSDFGKVLGKKSLKNKITSRNLNTIEKIVKKF
ncbi:hypothetical protein AP75_04005 [Kaistella haifensis DSM 19056]|uniref:DUF1697 domain-containing protein n=1 Tax=Kaistella haifensis DSM 19056 TaxID=1450526 RepID=A0A246BAZ3_9FLAO|nr:DUF1697 domain-containing protein [Kaistella haifensis]OWK98825.1 hypothetical protein AP75_04005 [Kaistella haifensis DSM 19056]